MIETTEIKVLIKVKALIEIHRVDKRGNELTGWLAITTRWTAGDRLGSRPQILGRSHAVLAERGMVTSIVFSFALLSVALKSVPFGTAYALWTGIGAVGTMIIGMVMFGELTDAVRVTCLTLIIAGMVGLKFASDH